MIHPSIHLLTPYTTLSILMPEYIIFTHQIIILGTDAMYGRQERIRKDKQRQDL